MTIACLQHGKSTVSFQLTGAVSVSQFSTTGVQVCVNKMLKLENLLFLMLFLRLCPAVQPHLKCVDVLLKFRLLGWYTHCLPRCQPLHVRERAVYL